MLSDRERRFLAGRRVAHLATADARAVPHVVPVCFAIARAARSTSRSTRSRSARSATGLKRVENIVENPAVAVVVDRYDEDWTRLGWVMLRGRAEILAAGSEHDDAQALLRSRYPQLAAMQIAHLPVIALRIARVTSWGNLVRHLTDVTPARQRGHPTPVVSLSTTAGEVRLVLRQAWRRRSRGVCCNASPLR